MKSPITRCFFHILRDAQRFPDQAVLIDSRNEIQKIEQEGRLFLYAVKWLDAQSNLKPGPQEIDSMHRKLQELNEKYKKKYALLDQETTALIPCFFVREESESHEYSLGRMADLVRRAILELHHLMLDNDLNVRFFLPFPKRVQEEVENDLMQLAWFLFRCGYTVDRIASGYYKDCSPPSSRKNPEPTDQHVQDHGLDPEYFPSSWLICFIDFSSFFEIQSDYVDLDDPKEVSDRIRTIKSRKRAGENCSEKSWNSSEHIMKTPTGSCL